MPKILFFVFVFFILKSIFNININQLRGIYFLYIIYILLIFHLDVFLVMVKGGFEFFFCFLIKFNFLAFTDLFFQMVRIAYMLSLERFRQFIHKFCFILEFGKTVIHLKILKQRFHIFMMRIYFLLFFYQFGCF